MGYQMPADEGEVERLTEGFIIEYTYNSNAIEGNTLTLRETDMVLRGLTIGRKPLKGHMEAAGHKEAFDFVRDLVKKPVSLSESIIKQILYLDMFYWSGSLLPRSGINGRIICIQRKGRDDF
ncbi:MAG: hypothetical protein HFG60_10685 [Lachnospiraceae bacterium]|nr:hypothetical protein [Lachnospiraceae bacterium]